MERNDVFNALFNTIRDSLDWAYEVENKEYASFIDGVICFGSNLLEQLDKKERKERKWTKYRELKSLLQF